MTIITKRERIGSWAAEFKAGRWFAVDRRTGRWIKAHDATAAVQMAADNNTRELCGAAQLPYGR